jgi:hypothetical protein
MRRTILSAGFAIGMMLLVAAPASATAPDREFDSFSFSDSADCGSFIDDYAGTVTIRSTTFFDAAGNPIMARGKVMQRETDTNSETGKSVLVKGSYTESVDLVTGIRRTTGQVFMGVGGKGANAIHDTGLVIFNDITGEVIKVAGPHTVLAGGNAPFCKALR